MSAARALWAVVPVKAAAAAKQRLAGALAAPLRQALALAMLEDVLAALAAAPALAGIVVATSGDAAARIAAAYGARVSRTAADDGHSEAVTAAARALAGAGAAMLTVPADIPLIEPGDIAQLAAAHRSGARFAIVPSRDGRGSNAVMCSPANTVLLSFGEDSFGRHLAAARARGLEPQILRLPRIALDIDDAADLAKFLATPSRTRARALLERSGCRDTPPRNDDASVDGALRARSG